MPPLSVARALGTLSESGAPERTVRRLDLVCPSGKTAPSAVSRPKDPRTVAQLLCRARFKTASRRYSRSLTEAERAVCIAAGAKLRSRTRHGQRGPLTGQQYWVRQDSAQAKVNVNPTKAKTAPQLLQPERVTRSTSDQYRIYTGHTPSIHRPGALQARKGRGGRGPRARVCHGPRDSPAGCSRRRPGVLPQQLRRRACCPQRAASVGRCPKHAEFDWKNSGTWG